MAGKSENEEIMYEEFEPFCKWQRKEDRDVLEIHLQDFKKEQLKVQISNRGVLKISGERALESDNTTKRAKFYKEVSAPSNIYDTHSIQAKFVDSHLIITLPKCPKPKPLPQEISDPPKSRDDGDGSGSGGGRIADQAPTVRLEGNVLCQKKSVMRSRLAKVAASLAVTAVAAVLLAAYVHYMYKCEV